MLRKISDLTNFSGKTFLVRIDTNVDIDDGQIVDDTRLRVSKATVEFIIQGGGKVIVIGHLGRPGGKVLPEFSLFPIAQWFAKEYSGKLLQESFSEFPGWRITDKIAILENIRFFPGEEDADEALAEKLSSLGDVFINDAFSVSHRNHSSVFAIAKLLPSYAGFQTIKEIEALSRVLENPQRPLAVIIGGAKIETKLPLVEMMCKSADYVLVGGVIAQEKEVLNEVFAKQDVHTQLLLAELTEEKTDVSQKSVDEFIQVLGNARMIVWNGPIGLIRKKRDRDEKDTEKGTRQIAEAIIKTSAYTIVGGGDTLSYLSELHLLDNFSFVSTGGGAMLEFLSGKELPGIEVLKSRDTASDTIVLNP